MKFIFKDPSGVELALPVTPPSFEVSHGIKVETINIHAVGDVIIGGYGTLCTVRVECMLPASHYPFSYGNEQPYAIVERLKTWSANRSALRFIVTETDINIPVLIEEIKYGEKDGTRDVYATLTLREYRALVAAKAQKADRTENMSREATSLPAITESYTVVKGDTLSAICRKFYGDPKLYDALAKYNRVKNPNLIFPGQTLRLPEKALLEGAKV